jgi:vacuolar protein sorting-associated protein 16
LYRDEEKLHTYRGNQAAKASIDIYSCAGKLIKRINWDKGSIKGLGWSENEQLLVITEEGTVRCYYDLQGDFDQFSLGNGAEEFGVKSCRFWGSGFVALLGNNRLISVSNYYEPRPKLLAQPPNSPIHSWAVIPPAYTLSRSVEVLVALEQTIHIVDATQSEDRGLSNGPFTHMSVSPNGKFVSLFMEDGKLWVITSDFQQPLSEYDSRVKDKPKDLQWCGNNSVAVAWEDEVHMVGPSGSASKYFYDSRVHMIPELDGVRLVTNDTCDFLQKVPDVTEEVFKFGSTSPAAVLLDAVDQLEKRSPKADDNIQLIRDNLAEAVDVCVRAAGHEYAITWQKQLLKAASFGKSVLELFSSDDFVDMCETLRVLNAVRYYEVGLALSYDQYIRLTPEKLVQRLVNRQEHLLALRVSEYLRLPVDRIYIHWARQKVRLSNDDEDSICRLITTKLEGKRGISYEEIARTAYDEGRGRLATQLLNFEPRAGKQVPLLLNMEEDEIALDKAIESGDTDLIFFVLLQLKKKLPLASFFRVINNRPIASALVESSARSQDQELLKDLYYQDDRRVDGANVILLESLGQPTTQLKIDKLKIATKLLSDSKDSLLEVRSLEESAKLLRLQEGLEKDIAGEKFLDLSVNDTLFKLLRLGYNSRAKKVVADFKIPDKRFWWIRLRALVQKRDFAELEEVGTKNRKSPIGWEVCVYCFLFLLSAYLTKDQPFFNEILSAGNPKSASHFIPKCTSLPVQDRIDMWVKCGLLVKAGEEAVKSKDVAALEVLKGKASGGAKTELERMLAQMRPGR